MEENKKKKDQSKTVTPEMEARFRRVCRERGLRITPQRTVVFRELAGAGDHPALKDLHARVRRTLPNISFDTVYRTALSLVEAGLAQTVGAPEVSRRFDGDASIHYHCCCLSCGRVIDFQCRELDRAGMATPAGTGFTVTARKVVFEGYCRRCRPLSRDDGREMMGGEIEKP